ncbi:MAG: ABC transporter permease [Bacteroidales bacterium]|nr:ABC transporter permease [Bacteroidales bacterium]
MNLHKLGIIIGREYLNKVKKKSFLIITFVAPVVFAALCILPSLIMMGAKEETKKVAVVDASGLVLPTLENTDVVAYYDFTGRDVDSLKTALDAVGMDVVLDISPLDSVQRTVTAHTYSAKPLGMETSQIIENRINDAIETYRIESYKIKDLDKIMSEVKSNIHLVSYTVDDSGKESISESSVYMVISMLLGMALYMFIALFCGMVMSSVIEEKSSRVVEVLVSSVKATELMFGKIIGVALVALTQFLLWILLTGAILAVAAGIVGKDKIAALTGGGNPTEMVQQMAPGVNVPGMDVADLGTLLPAADTTAVAADSTAVAEPTGMEAIFSTLGNLDYGTILLAFLLYFIFGYLLYASMFAAIGSAVENEADTQQLQIPVTIPLLLGFFIAIYAFKAPESQIVFWGSMIPFTSPIVMLARLPFGVPTWELILSVAILIGTFALFAWMSAKIYKVGILMYGKKSTFKDLWKWLKQK